MVRSVLEKARGAKLALSPFPHIVIPDALDADYYQELMREFPTIETVNVKNKALRNNDDCFMGAVDVSKSAQVSSTWKEFFAYHTSREFLMEALALAGSAATQLHPALSAVLAGMRKEDVVVADSDRPGKFHMQCQFGMNSPVISEKSVRIAHIDKPMKIYNALLYCRADDDDSVGGELQISQDPGILWKPHRASRADNRGLVCSIQPEHARPLSQFGH
jgi:hypothetical protein